MALGSTMCSCSSAFVPNVTKPGPTRTWGTKIVGPGVTPGGGGELAIGRLGGAEVTGVVAMATFDAPGVADASAEDEGPTDWAGVGVGAGGGGSEARFWATK